MIKTFNISIYDGVERNYGLDEYLSSGNEKNYLNGKESEGLRFILVVPIYKTHAERGIIISELIYYFEEKQDGK